MSGAILAGEELLRSRGRSDATVDVAVVGSGAGGAVVAALLAEAGQEVAVLEEGPRLSPEEHGAMRVSQSMRHLWRDGGLTFALGLRDTPMINVTMGRALGGSSLLTGGVCFRTPGHILDVWVKERGLPELSEEKLAPYFEEVERAVHVEEVPVALRSKSTELFGRGAEKLGFAFKPLRRNTKGCRGCGRCNFGCPHQAKMSVDLSYLPRAVAAGARLYTGCKVERVLTRAGRAVGVAGRLASARGIPGEAFTLRAKRVVLAAGAYFNPGLLRKSGLAERGGPVGKHLTLHPGFRVMARAEERIEGWKGALQSAYSDALEEDHITLVGLFLPPGVLAATAKGIGPKHARNARAIPELAVFGGMIHDEAGGEIHSLLGRTFATYRMSRADRARIPLLLRTMSEIFFEGGAKEVYLPILGMEPITADRLRTLDLAKVPAKQLECSSQHPLGTCRMGADPRSSAIDARGKRWGVEELYVADGSAVPTSLGVNPQLTIMAMATRVAHLLRETPLPS